MRDRRPVRRADEGEPRLAGTKPPRSALEAAPKSRSRGTARAESGREPDHRPTGGGTERERLVARFAPSEGGVARRPPPPLRERLRAQLADGASAEAGLHAAAERGVEGHGRPLPHLDVIQKSFGAHDVSHVEAHTGLAATEASRAIGARAYATGDHVAFAGSPSLYTAAHEAAHVVQQRAGVHLEGGVGQGGDPWERHADAVAERVVQGRSAEALLGRFAGGRRQAAAGAAVQRQKGGDEHKEKSDLMPKAQVAVPDATAVHKNVVPVNDAKAMKGGADAKKEGAKAVAKADPDPKLKGLDADLVAWVNDLKSDETWGSLVRVTSGYRDPAQDAHAVMNNVRNHPDYPEKTFKKGSPWIAAIHAAADNRDLKNKDEFNAAVAQLAKWVTDYPEQSPHGTRRAVDLALGGSDYFNWVKGKAKAKGYNFVDESSDGHMHIEKL